MREVMQAVAKNSGDVGVVDKRLPSSAMISADDIVRGLSKAPAKHELLLFVLFGILGAGLSRLAARHMR